MHSLTAVVAQLVRALDCGSKCRGFKSRRSPISFYFPMTLIEAIILGIIQGLTEFFPVSSSGHLALGQYLLGMRDLHQYIFFDLICHLGTLIALLIVYYSEIKTLFLKNPTGIKQVLIGTLPLFPLVLILKPIKSLFDQPHYLGYFFLFSSFMLAMGIYFGKKATAYQQQKHPFRDACIIGLFQAVAILPGISRSGTTISAGRLLKWNTTEAITFSFLLAIPAILGAITLESFQLLRSHWNGDSVSASIGFSQYCAGFIFSFGIGYLALKALMRVAAKEKFSYFAWYCLFIGLFSIVYL